MPIDDHEDLVRLPDASAHLGRPLWLSVGIHAAALLVLLVWTLLRGPLSGPSTTTIEFAMAPRMEAEDAQEPREPRQLADAVAPTEQPQAPAERIAEVDSRAQDQSPSDSSRNVPLFREASPDEIIAHQATAPPSAPPPAAPEPSAPQPAAEQPEQPAPQPPAPPAEPKPKTDLVKESAPKPAQPKPDTKKAESPKPTPAVTAPRAPAESGAEAPKQDKPEGPPSPGGLAVEESRGSIDSGVKNEGIAAFEAVQSQLAPYLKAIRQRVERNWRTALHTKFSGTSPTKAILDCAIAPDGSLASVVIIEGGESVSYAAICKEAIEQAAPFGAFPFPVPDMYRSKNLEIRWTFNFLRQ